MYISKRTAKVENDEVRSQSFTECVRLVQLDSKDKGSINRMKEKMFHLSLVRPKKLTHERLVQGKDKIELTHRVEVSVEGLLNRWTC